MKNKLSLGSIKKVRLIATVFADNIPFKPAIISQLKKTRSQYEKVNITAMDERDWEDNIFIVTKEDEEAAETIMENSPWNVMGFATHVQPWSATTVIEDLSTH